MISLPLPWRQADSAADYSAVVVPLEEAHQHSHAYRLRSRSDPEGQLDEDAFDDEGGVDKGGHDEGTAMLMTSSAPPEYSIEGLRREVRRGGKGEKWTAYESEQPRLAFFPFLFETLLKEADGPMTVKSRLLNKAIQDIGMGRYNWQLFVLCGFGWFADKYVSLPGWQFIDYD